MHIFSDATSTHDYNTRSHTILDHPTTHLFGSEKCVRYQLPRVIEKADPNILEKVNTHCYIGFCLYGESVYKITNRNAASGIAIRAKIEITYFTLRRKVTFQQVIPYPATSFNRIVCDRIPYWVALLIAVLLYLSFSLPTVLV